MGGYPVVEYKWDIDIKYETDILVARGGMETLGRVQVLYAQNKAVNHIDTDELRFELRKIGAYLL